MRLTVTQSGGFAGLTRRWSVDLPQSRCDHWEAALRSAQQDEHNRPDERIYDITLGDLRARVREHEVRQGDLADLLHELQRSTRGALVAAPDPSPVSPVDSTGTVR
ncbi:protealysin inhibitor emfourin [Arthrobacter sp. NPDC092385]|uniref:protealysin inhibitor emfourin n=1 Tax=Arthrobacter sp. NPDC092385 TaxID=3363943 RepID=UPI0038204D58